MIPFGSSKGKPLVLAVEIQSDLQAQVLELNRWEIALAVNDFKSQLDIGLAAVHGYPSNVVEALLFLIRANKTSANLDDGAQGVRFFYFEMILSPVARAV